jgi:hypothetical protein
MPLIVQMSLKVRGATFPSIASSALAKPKLAESPLSEGWALRSIVTFARSPSE